MDDEKLYGLIKLVDTLLLVQLEILRGQNQDMPLERGRVFSQRYNHLVQQTHDTRIALGLMEPPDDGEEA